MWGVVLRSLCRVLKRSLLGWVHVLRTSPSAKKKSIILYASSDDPWTLRMNIHCAFIPAKAYEAITDLSRARSRRNGTIVI